jgi:hypothetical protein
MVSDGHELGNHGYLHQDWTELADSEIVADLVNTEQVVAGITGSSPKPWARPPYGAVDARVLEVLGREGYHAIYRDAVDGGHWPDETTQSSIRQRVRESATDGAIIVFHTDRPDTAASLASILGEVQGAGFKFGSLSRLGSIPSSRVDLHPDFQGLEIRTGYIRPQVAGHWRSFNLHEMGAASTRRPNLLTNVAIVGRASLALLTGDPSGPFEGLEAETDRHIMVLDGDVRCVFRSASGDDLALVLARTGDLVLWPNGTRVLLECTRRWSGLLISAQLT